MKKLTVVIPTYNAKSTIETTLASIKIQSIFDDINIYLALDNPKEEHVYDYLTKQYDNLTIIPCTENAGPGIARQRGLDRVTTPFVTFIDADDVFWSPYSLEHLMMAFNQQKKIVMTQGAFVHKIITPKGEQFMPRNDVGHPWVFGRIYNVDFLKKNDIKFSTLRAMEDGEFNAKLRMLVEGSEFGIQIIDEVVYDWKEGSEHSITRTHTKDNEIPIYNYGLCSLGSNKCFANAIEFCNKKNPFNPSITRISAEIMVNQYFTYYECLENYDAFAEQNNWNAKWWYNHVFKKYSSTLEYDKLEEMYMVHPKNLRHEPKETFRQWFDRISTEEFSDEQLKDIREKLPKEIIELEKKSGCFESFEY